MVWLVSLFIFAVIATIVVCAYLLRRHFEQSLREDVRTLKAMSQAFVPSSVGADLPPPVAHYRRVAVGELVPVHTMRMTHGGTFRMSPVSKALPIEGTQLFTVDPPGFLWTGRVHLANGIWIDARDSAIAGRGCARVLLDDVVPLAHARGPHVDQGAALRLLAEMVWYPTSLFDPRNVTWSPIDADHARASLRVGRTEVSGIFEFGADGLPVAMSAERYIDEGELRPWRGVYRDWRIVMGMHVPFEVVATWQLASGPFAYAHWIIYSISYDSDFAADNIAAPSHRRALRAS